MTQATTPETTSRKAAVYRLYDADETLLYIGSAYDPDEREAAHRHTEWGQRIARRADEWHGSRKLAYEFEAEAIRAESPLHLASGQGARSFRAGVNARFRVAGQG